MLQDVAQEFVESTAQIAGLPHKHNKLAKGFTPLQMRFHSTLLLRPGSCRRSTALYGGVSSQPLVLKEAFLQGLMSCHQEGPLGQLIKLLRYFSYSIPDSLFFHRSKSKPREVDVIDEYGIAACPIFASGVIHV